MRNLNTNDIHEVLCAPDELPLTATTFDSNTGDVICTHGPTISRSVIELKRYGQGTKKHNNDSIITSWDAPCPLPELECDEVLCLHYFPDSSSICVVLAGGDLVLVREQPLPEQERIEIVGSIDAGLCAAQWSWNASLLALVTRTGSLVLMSQQLEPVNEITFQQDDLQLSKHVSVGWGKRETQFQGKRAKAMKDPTMPDTVDEGKPSPHEDGKTNISWRGDGAYVAVNTVLASSRRVIRVYSSEGTLESVSEPVDGLESALSWRPYGNLIASVKRTSDRLEVVFFEKNGLLHGQFDLRLNGDNLSSFGTQVSLNWNSDSSILAVRLLDRVLFWTMDNYHYSLKQDLRFREIRLIIWHPVNSLRCLLSSCNKLQSVSFHSQVLKGSVCAPFDYGLVAVVDGKNFKLTPLKHVNTPPPMAYIEITADDNIVCGAISRTCQRVAFLTHNHVYLCKLDMQPATRKADNPSIRHSGNTHVKRLKLPNIGREYTQVLIQDDDKVHLFSPARGSLRLDKIETSLPVHHQYIWVSTSHNQEELQVSDMSISQNTKQLLLDLKQEMLFAQEHDIVAPLLRDSPSLACQSSGSCEISRSLGHEDDFSCATSLSDTQRLVISTQDIRHEIPDVTSFATTDTHVIYTTSAHFLKFIHLNGGKSFSEPGDTPEVDERCRTVERGSLIVTVVPSIYAVILQMPRGNLETIYPRIMVLSGIRSHIRNRDYRNAFLACQTHQVDLNILFDYDPDLFLANVTLFIDQLKKPSRVDEFLQKIRNEDVTVTLYHDTSSRLNALGTDTRTSEHANKVNRICDSMISELRTRPAIYQTNMITAHVCKKPPDLASALTLVSDIRKSSVEEADLAIAHLCFLTDTNRLYDTALSLYDLELTLLVAQNAQRDPREYMPFLQSLQALPVLRRQYTIDNHLKKYARAVVSLHQLEEHDEVEAYTVKHILYTDTIQLYKHSPTQHSRITRLYAEYLSTHSKHAQAAALYEALSDFGSAYPLYTLAHMWREALSCACLVPVSQTQLHSLARSLSTTCAEESRDYRSAATILLDYLQDAQGAAELLCKGSYFAEATRVLSHPDHSRVQNFVPTEQLIAIIDTALTRKFGEILELIAECQTQLKSQVPRIEELRIKKGEDPFAFFGGETSAADGIDIPDNVSLAPTDASTLGGQSMFTRYGGGAGGSQVSTKFGGTVRSDASRKTSKTRRKEERKKAQGKKGSVYEEEYLVASCGRLIERVNGVHDEVRRLVSGLCRRNLREQAVKVEEVMQHIQDRCEDARKRVWQVPSQSERVADFNETSGLRTHHADSQTKPDTANGLLSDDKLETRDASCNKVPEVRSWKSGVA